MAIDYVSTEFEYSLLKSEGEKSLYRTLVRNIAEHEPVCSAQGMVPLLISRVIRAVLIDNPQFFWFEGKWEYPNENIKLIFTIDRNTSEIFEEKINSDLMKIDALCPKDAGEAEIVRFMNNWIIDNISYGTTYSQGQTIADVFINREAVCKGLSKALQLLLVRKGIFATLRYGSLNMTERHAWNVVKVNGKYYNVDVSNGHFLVSDWGLRKTHKLIDPVGAAITCSEDYTEN